MNAMTHTRKASASSAAPALKIGRTDDAFEREADRKADEVMTNTGPAAQWSFSRMSIEPPLQRKCSCGGSREMNGECEECKARGTLQRRASGTAEMSHAPAIVHEVLRSSGASLDGDTRSFFEPRFGYDFSRVRVHTDAHAAASAKAVGALAYTVGNDVVFGIGRYAPATSAGRRLLAHELTHTIQQSAESLISGRRRVSEPPEGRGGSAGSAGPSVHAGKPWPRPLRAGRAPSSRLQRAPAAISATDDFSAIVARLETIIRTGGTIPGETRVIAAVIVDIPGYPGPVDIRTISAAATDALGEGAAVHHAPSPAPGTRTLSATRSIAGAGARREFPFSHVNDAEMKAFEEISHYLEQMPNPEGSVHFLTMRVRQIGGRTVFEPIPACSGCTRATFEMGSFRGVKMISHAATHPTGTLNLGDDPEGASGAKAAPEGDRGATDGPSAGEPTADTPGATSVKVGTKIEVVSSAKQPNGSTISEVEYNFGENLEQLNHGAPPGGQVPSKIVIRVTQNAEGVITSVESVSGELQALVEALAQRTLPGAAGGEAAAATEGAAAALGRRALLFRGLKIGGWAAFAVITGYQLYKATPAQRPRVLAGAAGGVAGGAAATYLVCNALLDIETAGWGLVICGFVAGGAGAYGGSKAGEAIYDEATATDLDRALHRLDARSASEQTVFNILVGKMGSSSGCIDANFVDEFLSALPPRLTDSQVILIAAQLAAANVTPPRRAPLTSRRRGCGPGSHESRANERASSAAEAKRRCLSRLSWRAYAAPRSSIQ